MPRRVVVEVTEPKSPVEVYASFWESFRVRALVMLLIMGIVWGALGVVAVAFWAASGK